MLKRFGMFAVTGVLALMVLAACGSEDDDAEPTVTRIPATNAPQVTATAAEAEEEETAAASPAAASPVVGSPVASPVASEGAPPVASESASPVAEETATTEATTTAASPVASPVASPSAETTQVPPPPTGFEVDMKDIAFDPKEIRIPANTDIVIKLPNTGVTTHNFNIDALGIKSGDVAAGAEASVTINAAPGTYDYYCSIPGHKEAGMVGKLIVE